MEVESAPLGNALTIRLLLSKRCVLERVLKSKFPSATYNGESTSRYSLKLIESKVGSKAGL